MITLTVANPSHTAEVATLLAALFAEVDADDGHSTLLAIEEDDEEIGVVGIMTVATYVSLYAGGKIGAINELYVIPDYRSEGVGKMLLDFAKEIGEQQDWLRLEVTTPGDDYDKTLRFYEREGFHRIGPRFKYEF